MNLRIRLAISIFLVLLVVSAAHGRLYRWVDVDGNVHYADKIPPTQVERGHHKLSDKGIRVDTVAPAMTADEILREKELERQRKEQERLIEAQRAADRSLLSTYRSVEDLLMARDGQLAFVDVTIQATKGAIRRQQEWLRRLRSEAANMERAGKTLPQDLRDSIAKTEHKIVNAYATILSREQRKQVIRDDFHRDRQRFTKLKGLPEDTTADATRSLFLTHQTRCESQSACSASWARATDYVRTHANTPILYVGDALVINEPPVKGGDVSLALALIRDSSGDGATLFLDLQCKRFETSETACRTEPGTTVVNGFQAAVSNGDEKGGNAQ